MIRKKKNVLYKQKMKDIEKLKKSKPKEFWKYFNGSNGSNSSQYFI